MKFHSKVSDLNLPKQFGSNTGGGMRCGECLKTFKSFLRLKKHQADFHGAVNEFSAGIDMSLTNRKSLQKERLHISEEKLKEEISKIIHKN